MNSKLRRDRKAYLAAKAQQQSGAGATRPAPKTGRE